MKWLARAAPVAALVAVSCSDSPNAPIVTGLRFVAGAAEADTVGAEPATPLEVVVLTREGDPAAGVAVDFESVVVLDAGPAGPLPVETVLVDGADGFGPATTAHTDASGHAAVRVKLGRLAGAGGIVVSVRDLALRDTARYTIRPGAAVTFTIQPADTAIYVGGTVRFRAGWADRHGNLRDDPVTLTGGAPVVQRAGDVATGLAYGVAEVVATSGVASTTARVSVVPRGTIAAFRDGPGNARGLVITVLDGSTLRQITAAEVGRENVPYWSPTGDRIVYHDGGAFAHLFTVTTTGISQPLPGSSPVTLDAEKWAQYSRDGEWVYYSGHHGLAWSLWRVRAAGGGAERIGPFAASTQADAAPSPSPDGGRLVFWTNRYGDQRLALLDIATGAFEPIGPTGSTARWAPQGERIAYIDGGALALIDSDGTNAVTLVESGIGEWIDWSPDGTWIVAAGESRLWVIRAADGLRLPIPHTAGMRYPSWRPTAD